MGFETDVKKIVSEYRPPRIGVIGGTCLSRYNEDLCIAIGAALRMFADKEGWLFTGGVEGVGLEVYRGIARYSSEHKIDDRFFTLLPYGSTPWGYNEIARRLLKKEVKNESCGIDMSERRAAVSRVGTVLIMVEGGDGTWDEASQALRNKTPLISFYKSGGSAAEFAEERDFVHPVADVNEMVVALSNITKTKN